MLVATCPSCGARAPVSVATPDSLRCPYCGYQGPPPGAVAAELRRAGAALYSMQVGRRQLSRDQLRALHSGGCAGVMYATFCAVLAVPFLIWAWAAVASSSSESYEKLMAYGMGLLPVALLSVAAWFGLRAIRRARTRLEQACAAEPSGLPGEPARCHVCGGELGPSATAVVRCAFCQADNIVSARAMEERRARQELVVGDYERIIAQRSSAMGQTSMRVGCAVFGSALAAPVAAVFATGVVVMTLRQCNLPPDDGVRYVIVTHAGQRCIARLSHDEAGHAISDFGKKPPKGFARTAPAARASALAPSALVGKKVFDFEHDPAHVQGVWRKLLDRQNYLDLEASVDQPVIDSCLVVDSPKAASSAPTSANSGR